MTNKTFRLPMGDHFIGHKPTDIEVDEKAWGSETIITRGNKTGYAAKIMTLKPGTQVSMHWHGDKCETFILISGQMIVEVLEPSSEKHIIRLEKLFSSVTLKPQTPHTFYTPDNQVGDTIFIEASTLDRSDDSYRLTKSGPRQG